MNRFVILGIALGLAMDAVAVSVSCGITLKKPRLRDALRIAGSFGFFQAAMPVLGWAAGFGFRKVIESVDHWIAAALLGFIGIRMIIESGHVAKKRTCPTRPGVLLMLSVATSIDALAAGLSFSFLNTDIWGPAMVIGVVTFTLSLGSVMLGRRLGVLFEKKVEAAGGVILIAIGVKILLQHLGVWA
ncbi:MAG TPA: manganese efflux pump MntP family protein [bacterium]